MTAEGDNSVLMQKVAKERLATFKPVKTDKCSPDVNSTAFLHSVLANRSEESGGARSIQRFFNLAVRS